MTFNYEMQLKGLVILQKLQLNWAENFYGLETS